MSYRAVAKKDFQDGIRSKLLWGLVALFVLSIAGFSLIASRGATSPGEDELFLIGVLGVSAVLAITILIPLTGLVVSIKSIVRERELGSIKVLLSLPHTRGEVIVGKFIGRSGLLTAAILSGFVPAALIVLVHFGTLPVYEYVAFVLVTLLFGTVFVAVGIGMSSLVSTETRANVAGFGFFILLYFWDSIFGWINGQLGLFSGDAERLVFRFDLFVVFWDSLMALLSIRYDEIPNASAVAYGETFQTDLAGEAASQPFYLQHWFAFVILALWIAVPLAIGYRRFERTDL
ncbi:ABC transporter permease subunit [Halovivax sp.]|uniref:ABC transporter permease subunit n=1 Tax=Halovivax sp. TaxID=1935978 RepID=UPI0025C34466|nr:ABC transporter permease subunit [Halovivax sp.]